MKALTIKEPWASLIINGHKQYEFRSWRTHFRGKFYIHAGLSIEKQELSRFEEYKMTYACGAIIGEANLVDCVWVDEKFKMKLLDDNPEIYRNSEGFAFVLENVIKYDKPILCKGHLSFWEYPDVS